MGYITILPEELACQEDYLANHLPTRYMEDFTLLGFTVSTLSRAVDLLDNAGWRSCQYHLPGMIILLSPVLAISHKLSSYFH